MCHTLLHEQSLYIQTVSEVLDIFIIKCDIFRMISDIILNLQNTNWAGIQPPITKNTKNGSF